MPTPKAHLVDDDEAIRDAVAWLFQSRQIPCRTYLSAEDFLSAGPEELSGCVVLDIRMTGMSGLELFDTLQERGIALPTIFLTGHGDVPMAVAALKKGAYDFFEKPFNDNELANRVLEALEHDARQRSAQASAQTIAARLDTLTSREKQVMELILAGKFNKVIADELKISMRTVEVHRARLLDKMGVKTAVELAQLLNRRS
ncbi:response regulator transcription factor [Azovibrio restrictus]|uniref:response regulator transcription factor n=1 Tax=Azovibrio restrictus TaxID=146938 RepID=UPI0026F106ED|nr:response regulator [Azovibrio restrictus]MDD3484282.1 response regulator [Azovibrio restrictus]